jgi:hypothetical protein
LKAHCGNKARETMNATSEHRITRIILIVLLAILDGVNISLFKIENPRFVYVIGLFIGIITGYLISLPRAPRFWVIFLIASILAMGHFVLVPYFGH